MIEGELVINTLASSPLLWDDADVYSAHIPVFLNKIKLQFYIMITDLITRILWYHFLLCPTFQPNCGSWDYYPNKLLAHKSLP